ncbi:hypothetical protein J3F83DRAFT_729007 [Trichoderma novae-zelandiae]
MASRAIQRRYRFRTCLVASLLSAERATVISNVALCDDEFVRPNIKYHKNDITRDWRNAKALLGSLPNWALAVALAAAFPIRLCRKDDGWLM